MAKTDDRVREIERVGGQHSISVASMALDDVLDVRRFNKDLIENKIGWVHMQVENRVANFGAGEIIKGFILLKINDFRIG